MCIDKKICQTTLGEKKAAFRDTQPETRKSTADNKSAASLLPFSQQADIRMPSHRLLWLDDNKSAASLLPCSHQADIRIRSHCMLWLDDTKSLQVANMLDVS